MGGLWSRVKTWTTRETFKRVDINAEIDNVIENQIPAQFDDYSDTVTEMKKITDPGEAGTESLATNLSGEIERLRFQLKAITGKEEWFESPAETIESLKTILISATDLPENRIESGRTRSTSNQPQFLKPAGVGNGRTVTLEATATDFKVRINGILYIITSDVTSGTLIAAPASTCLVNNGGLSRIQGEWGTAITVDTVVGDITTLTNKIAGYTVNTGGGNEPFIGVIDTALTSINNCFRGFFYDENRDPVNREILANNNTITLLKLTWVFIKTDGTLTQTYNTPVLAQEEPSSPDVGDFWFDIPNKKWKHNPAGSFVDANATLIGITLQDGSDCIMARSFDFFKAFSSLNTIKIQKKSNDLIDTNNQGGRISVYGNIIQSGFTLWQWSMATDRAIAADMYDSTEQANRDYYIYIKDTGEKVISDISPYNRPDLSGFYHPHNTWRCIGLLYNNSSNNISIAANEFGTKLIVVVGSTNDPSTSSTSPVLIAQMTFEILSMNGRYNIHFSAHERNTNADGKMQISLYIDTVQIHAELQNASINAEESQIMGLHATTGKLIPGRHLIEAKFRVALGTGRLLGTSARRMTAILGELSD